MRHGLSILVLAFVFLGRPAVAAGEDGDEKPQQPFKLTTGLYHFTGGGLPSEWGLDVNLRHTSQVGNVWIGWFGAQHQMDQTRAGWDRNFDLGPVRLQPSLQIASGGFRGGSFYAEAGDDWYVGAGLGRTNLRPYVNLNFDPNDAWTLAAGRRRGDQQFGVLLVGDNRENPDQRHLHFIYRLSLPGQQRLSVDVLAKRGLVEGTMVRRLGLTVGYDWASTFVRLAWDPKANFMPQDMLRVSGGVRF